jgi:hypothetical protein
MELAHVRVHWWALILAVLNLRVLLPFGISYLARNRVGG